MTILEAPGCLLALRFYSGPYFEYENVFKRPIFLAFKLFRSSKTCREIRIIVLLGYL